MIRLCATVAFLVAMTVWSTVVDGHQWYLRALVLIATATVAAELVGRFRGPRGVSHLVALVVGVAGMTWMFSPGLGPVPTPSSFAGLQDLLQEGTRITNTTAAPVPPHTAVQTLVVGALFLLWWAVDVIAAGAGCPALAAAGLLVVYGVPAAVLPHALPVRYLVAGTVGLMLLLVSDRRERGGRWGHLVGRSRALAGYPAAVMAAVAAFTLAIMVPARLSATPGGWVYESRHADSGTSTALSTDLDLHSDLVRPTDRSLLRYTTSSPDPDPLRMFVVDSLDGDHWTPRPFEAGRGADPSNPDESEQADHRRADVLDPNPNLYVVRDRRLDVTVKALSQKYLPNPGDPLRLNPSTGSWNYDADLDTFSGSPTTRNMRYNLRYRQYIPRQRIMSRPGLKALSASSPAAPGLGPDIDLPPGVPAVLRRTARQVAGPATDSDYVRAQRLQAYFHSGDFSYSTDVGGSTSASAMADFLRNKRGYCVHFATTMTLMARSLGIPARVVVGLAPGSRDGSGWTAREHDAHAWPELFFDGIGWVRFEPTVGQTAPDWTVQADAPTPSDSSSSSASASSSSASPSESTPSATESDNPTSTATDSGASDPHDAPTHRLRSLAPWGVAAAGVLLVGAPALAAGAVRRRRRRGPDTAETGWAELSERLSDLGVDTDPARTVRGTGEIMAAAVGPDASAQEALARRVRAVEGSRYSAVVTHDTGTATDIRTITRAVAARSRWSRRLRARLLPLAVFRRGRH